MHIDELIAAAKQHMESEGYAADTIYKNHWIWRKLSTFAHEKGNERFDSALVDRFMRENYGVSVGEDVVDGVVIDQYVKAIMCSLVVLVDYSLHGHFSKPTHGEKCLWPEGFVAPCYDFVNNFSVLGYSKAVVRKHELRLNKFIRFVSAHGINTIDEITAENIYDYFRMMSHLSQSALSDLRRTLVRAFRHFYALGLCENDLSQCIPKIVYCARAKFSKIWDEKEIAKILGTIDRASPPGMRDYAIINIAANLGLRAVDIVNLRIEDFNWKQGVLTLTQQKTGEPLSLPFSEAIGRAVIDYWRDGRPKTPARELFVRLVYPYDKLAEGSLYQIFNKHIPAAGIPLPVRKHGLHSLRHSLASRMLETGASLKVVADVLGQVSPDTAKQYVRIAISQLRECALEVPDLV
jgi:site-specific recombinase XerD